MKIRLKIDDGRINYGPASEWPEKRARELIAAGHAIAADNEEARMTEQAPNHAQSIENVLGTFEGELRRLADRAAAIQAQTMRAFGDAHAAFDHADYINEVIGKATSRLNRFLGPPPNIIALPKSERDGIEDAVVVGGDGPSE